jgi:hypothetical protein
MKIDRLADIALYALFVFAPLYMVLREIFALSCT